MKNLIQFVLFLFAVRKTTGDEKVIYAQVGQSVTLNIQSTNDHYVNWYFKDVNSNTIASTNSMGGKFFGTDEKWKDRLTLSYNSLIISNIQEGNFGIFFCKVLYKNNIEVSLTKFTVVKVSVDVKPPSLVMPGETLTLKCVTIRDPYKPRIYWISPEGNEIMSEKFDMEAKSQVSGEWTCVVNEYSFPISVSVADISSPEHLYTFTNSNLKLPVSIKPVNYVQQIIHNIKKVECHFVPKTSSSPWLQSLLYSSVGEHSSEELDGRHLGFENFTNEGVFSLLIRQTKVEDRGSYNFSITFKEGLIMRNAVQVEVLQILSSPGAELISGHQLNLSCSIGGRLPPGVQVKWFPPKTSSLSNTNHSSEHLIIPKVSTSDSGTWRCDLLQNQTRLTSAAITLKIDPILSVWMVVIICGAAVILILLLVVGFILCRRRQRRVRHLRHRLCQCKHPKPKGFYKT